MNRRAFLKAASLAGAVTLAGCQRDGSETDGTPISTEDGAPTTSRTQEPPRDPTPTPDGTGDSSLETIRADVSDGDEVTDVIAAISSGQRLEFPAGRFRWSDEVTVTDDEWEIRCENDTVFEVPEGIGDGDGRQLLSTYADDDTADDIRLENLTFDSSGRAAPSCHLGVRNSGHVDGLEYEMNGPYTDQPQENGIQAFVENTDGRLQIDGYRQYNNGDLAAYSGGNSRIGIWVGRRNSGTVHLRNPILQGFPNNACYVSRQPGRVIIDGGLLMNNNVSAVRVSGGVQVRNSTIYIDVDSYREGPGRIEGTEHNTRGVWGDNRRAGKDGGLVTGTSFILKSYQRCGGVASILENPHMAVHNSQFLLDADIDCVQANVGQIEVSNCWFAGSSTDSTAGVGDVTGTGGYISPTIRPGAVPVKGRNASFRWIMTHPQTPGRPALDCLALRRRERRCR